MTRKGGTSGNAPVLTAAQREVIGKAIRRRNEIRAEIKALKLEFASLPTNSELVAKYGVTVQTLHSAANHTYANENMLDRINNVSRGTSPNNPQEVSHS